MSTISYHGSDADTDAEVRMPPARGADDSWGIMNDLPSDYVRMHYHSISNLRMVVNNVRDILERDGSGNQYILILGLPERMRKRLLDEDNLIGVSVRLELDGTSAVVKIPTAEHEACTTELMYEIRAICSTWASPPSML